MFTPRFPCCNRPSVQRFFRQSTGINHRLPFFTAPLIFSVVAVHCYHAAQIYSTFLQLLSQSDSPSTVIPPTYNNPILLYCKKSKLQALNLVEFSLSQPLDIVPGPPFKSTQHRPADRCRLASPSSDRWYITVCHLVLHGSAVDGEQRSIIQA